MTLYQKNKIISDMAQRCRDAYIRERLLFEAQNDSGREYYHPGPRWDGGIDSQGKTWKPIWPEMAKFLIKHGLDPETCIRIKFALRRETSNNAVLPNQIADKRYLEQYRGNTYESGRVERELHLLESEKECFRSMVQLIIEDEGLTATEAWRVALFDETLSLSPLFRYCVAVSENLTQVARYYRGQAINQYLCAPREYGEAWSEFLPTELIKEVEAALRISNKD